MICLGASIHLKVTMNYLPGPPCVGDGVRGLVRRVSSRESARRASLYPGTLAKHQGAQKDARRQDYDLKCNRVTVGDARKQRAINLTGAEGKTRPSARGAAGC